MNIISVLGVISESSKLSMSKLLPMPSEKASYVPVQQRNSLENETLLEDESPTTCSGGASDKFELYIVCGLLIASNIVLVITLVLIGLKTKGTNISLHSATFRGKSL